MMISEQMSVRRVCYVAVLVTLLFSSMTFCLEDLKVIDEVSSVELVDLLSEDTHEDMVDLLWSHCWTDLIQIKEIIEEVASLCLPNSASSSDHNFKSKCQSVVKETLQNIFSDLQPSSKRRLVDCLRSNVVVSHVSGKDESESWYTVYATSLSSKLGSTRRYLGSESAQDNSQAPASAPTPVPPTGSKDLSSPPPPGSPFFPSNDSSPSPTAVIAAENQTSGSGASSKNSSTHKAVAIAVAVTAVVTFAFAALLFLCYNRYCSTRSRRGRNDERPLLSLSLSDYSIGSPFRHFGFGNSIKEEKPGLTPANSSKNKEKPRPLSSFFEPGYMDDVSAKTFQGGPADGAANGWVTFDSPGDADVNASQYHLKPPPGRVGSTVGFLKPPPGRAQPLPPEPRAPPKPSGSTGGPPAASPAPPPPPPRPPPAAAPPPPPPPGVRPPGGGAAPTPPRPPPPPGAKGGPPPLPPKGGAAPKPPPPLGSKAPRPPLHGQKTSGAEGSEEEADAPKTKLKPFFWDKVLANPDQSMVWNQIKSGSFQFNEEMIETLFGYNQGDKNKNDQKKESSSRDPSPQYVQIIDAKKSQNLSILLRALNVTIEEVCDALHEGNELPIEFLQNLLKMAPTTDEELKLRLYSGELSQLGPADRFLKAMVGIPFAFKRMEALLFMSTLQEEVTMTKDSFSALEVACKELRNSRLFLKLLEAVLKTGNRMNDGTFRGGAQAFKLDTLLKLSDVKGVDGKTTLLHFVVQEIIRSEGVRAARTARESQSSISSVKSDDFSEDPSHDTEEYYRNLGLQVVSRLGSELENVKKAAAIDADSLTSTVTKLGHALVKTRNFLNTEMSNSAEESQFHLKLKSFVQDAEMDITWLLGEEKRIVALVKSTGDYFHGNAGKDEGLRLFVIVRNFLIMLDKVCKEIKNAPRKLPKAQNKEGNGGASSSEARQAAVSPDLRQRFFGAITERRMDSSSSDDDS